METKQSKGQKISHEILSLLSPLSCYFHLFSLSFSSFSSFSKRTNLEHHKHQNKRDKGVYQKEKRKKKKRTKDVSSVQPTSMLEETKKELKISILSREAKKILLCKLGVRLPSLLLYLTFYWEEPNLTTLAKNDKISSIAFTSFNLFVLMLLIV